MDATQHLHQLTAAAGLQQMERQRFGLESCRSVGLSLSDGCDWLQILQRATELAALPKPQKLGPSLHQIHEHLNTL